jgi:hypothetical protein
LACASSLIWRSHSRTTLVATEGNEPQEFDGGSFAFLLSTGRRIWVRP